MRTAVYPGTFDPTHNGHVDIACRAAGLFDRVIVAVYDTPSRKEVLFPTDQRVEMAQEALRQMPNVVVDKFSGLTVDYARAVGAQVLVRGLRAVSDFEMEFQWALMNRKLSPGVEVVCLVTSLRYIFTSSSNIKEVARLGGHVDDLVPPAVARALRERFSREEAPAPVPRYLTV